MARLDKTIDTTELQRRLRESERPMLRTKEKPRTYLYLGLAFVMGLAAGVSLFLLDY